MNCTCQFACQVIPLLVQPLREVLFTDIPTSGEKPTKGKCTQLADGMTGLLHFSHQVDPDEDCNQNFIGFERLRERLDEVKKATQLETMQWQLHCQEWQQRGEGRLR